MTSPQGSSSLDAACPLRAGVDPGAEPEDAGDPHEHGSADHASAHHASADHASAHHASAHAGNARPGGAHHDGHDHHHGGAGHDHHELHGAPIRRLGIALALTASFMGVEAAVGIWAGSLSLLADAGHMFADAAALAMAIAAQRIASRPRTGRQTYGFRRAEVLAAFVNGVVLVGVALGIVFEAVHRLGDPTTVHGQAMSYTAAGGLAVNVLSAWVLSSGGRSNVNVRAALSHVLSDAMGSVGALVAGLLVAFAGLGWADPVASVLIAGLVAINAVRLVRETTHVLMQGSPPGIDAIAIEQAVRDVPGVIGLHDLHLWRVSDGFDVVTVHVVVADTAAGTEVSRLVTAALRAEFGIEHATVQPEVDPPGDA